MALTQGAPLPSVTTTTTQAAQAPEYYTQYLTNLAQAGSQAMARPAAQQVAAYDPLQTQGYAAVPGAAQAYQPGLTAAQQTAAGVAQGITPERISAFMNPYTQSVVEEMARQSQQNVQRNIMPALKAGFVGTGGLGSQRYAGALGQTMADIQANLTGQQAGALQAGYTNALKAAIDEANLRRQAAETEGTLAGKAQEYGLTGAGALTKAGAERQAYQQSLLDAPLKTATSAANLMRGFNFPMTQQTTQVAPGQRGQFGLSTLDQIAGILSLIGATQGGTTGGPTGGNAQSVGYRTVADWLGRNIPSGISDLFGTGNASPEAQQGLADFILGYTPENYG